MVVRSIRTKAWGRDDALLERLAVVVAEAMPVGFTVSDEGLDAIRSELDANGRLFGFAVLNVRPQKQRVLAWWTTGDLDKYLAGFRLKK